MRLWNIPPKTATDPRSVANRRVFDAFLARHPGIRVKVLVPLRIEGSAAESSEFLAVAGGVAPDVFHLYGRKVGDYVAQGFLLPLNGYLRGYQARTGAPYGGVAAPHQVWELCVRGDQVLMVPESYYALALICDTAAFARAGLAGRAPRDWDALYETARRLTVNPAREPGGDPNRPAQVGLHVLSGLAAGWHFLQYVWSAGGEVVESYLPWRGGLERVPAPPVNYAALGIRLSNAADYETARARQLEDLRRRGLPEDYPLDDLEWRLVTDGPDALEALVFYRRLCHQPWLRNGDHEFDVTPAMLRAGRAVDPATGDAFDLRDPAVRARLYWGVARAADPGSGDPRLRRESYAMEMGRLDDLSGDAFGRKVLVPFPSRAGRPPAAFIAGSYFGINRTIVAEPRPGRRDAQAIRDAAWAYIEFMTGPEAERIRVATFADYGLAEFVRPALLEQAGYPDLLARIPPERRQLWDNLLRDARIEPYCKGFTHVMTRELGMAIEPILNDAPHPETGAFARDPRQLMETVCRSVNTLILGRMPAAEVRRRTRVGWAVMVAMVLALAAAARWVLRAAARLSARHRTDEGFGVGGHPARRRLHAWLFLLPALASVAIWQYYPLLRGLAMAFQDYRILGGSTFVGLRNFIETAADPKFWRYLLQTAVYVALSVGLGFGAPIALAILLYEIPRGNVLFRVLYYLPAVTSGLVTLFLWKHLLYDPSRAGLLNQVILGFNALPLPAAAALKLGALALALVLIVGFARHTRDPVASSRGRWAAGAAALLLAAGLAALTWQAAHDGAGGLPALVLSRFDIHEQAFLRDPRLVLLWVVLPGIWAGAGPGSLIYLAALKGIPEEQYEAADLDGATVLQKVRHITLPNLKALLIIGLVGAVIGGFKESGTIFVMTGGGPEDLSMTSGLYIWYTAFLFLNYGLATAMAWIMGALLIGFTLTQLNILNKIQFRAAGDLAAGRR